MEPGRSTTFGMYLTATWMEFYSFFRFSLFVLDKAKGAYRVVSIWTLIQIQSLLTYNWRWYHFFFFKCFWQTRNDHFRNLHHHWRVNADKSVQMCRHLRPILKFTQMVDVVIVVVAWQLFCIEKHCLLCVDSKTNGHNW